MLINKRDAYIFISYFCPVKHVMMIHLLNTIVEKVKLLGICFIILFVGSCNYKTEFVKENPKYDDYSKIQERGSLIVATGNNSTDYFLYKGEPMGFQFEMLKELGNYLGVNIEVLVCNNPGEKIALLEKGKCDMIASSWNLATSDKVKVKQSVPILETKLVLVQRKPSGILFHSNPEDSLITNVNQLRGKSVYVPFQSAQAEIMHRFAEESGEQINIYEMPQYSQEKLVELVASGDLDYTICNRIYAETLKSIYPELDFSVVVKEAEPIKWTFRSTSDELANKINNWLVGYKSSTQFALLTDKYFNHSNQWDVTKNRYETLNTNQLCAYDNIIKKYSTEIHWDWRLLASLIYQESRFRPNVRSQRGAWGLMQLMPSTQKFYGIDTTASPELQIKTGVKYLCYLDKLFEEQIPDRKERVNFILASYNIGPGHIFDAQAIAHKFGKNPLKWFNNVDTCLLSKSSPAQYRDPEVHFGYCKGDETYNFVPDILNRYAHYKNVLSE